MNSMKENDSVNAWLSSLEKLSTDEKKGRLARRLYELAALPKRRRISVNVSKLERHAKENENIVVPGKVLGSGSISKKLHIAAMGYSGDAAEKLKASKCSILSIDEMLGRKDVRIIT